MKDERMDRLSNYWFNAKSYSQFELEELGHTMKISRSKIEQTKIQTSNN